MPFYALRERESVRERERKQEREEDDKERRRKCFRYSKKTQKEEREERNGRRSSINRDFQREVSIFGKGGAGGVLHWWENAIGFAPHLFDHPVARWPWGDIAKTAPFYVHYDGAEVYRNQEYHIWSYGSVLCDVGSAFDRLFPIVSIPYAAIIDMKPVQAAVANLVKWSSTALLEGKWPADGGARRAPRRGQGGLSWQRPGRGLAWGFRGLLGRCEKQVRGSQSASLL